MLVTDLFRTVRYIIVYFSFSFFNSRFVMVQAVQVYSSADKVTTIKKILFYVISDHISFNISPYFSIHILISLWIREILLSGILTSLRILETCNSL